MSESEKPKHEADEQTASKPEITYPRPWDYTVIGLDAQKMRDAVKEVIGDEAYTIKPSHKSTGGKYVSLAMETIVLDEAMRVRIFEELRNHDAIRMVL